MLDTWDNRAIDAATATSDFSFRDIRRRPHAIYLVVESEMIRPLAPLIRLFFLDLIASLQAQEPGDDEPWPVMIMLDEFDRLGKMPIVAESIKTLRSFGGNLAIVTQTIPALDEIYGENSRRSLQGGAGVKLYLTPSEQKTIEELSQAVGKTTKRVVTRSRAVGRNPFEGRSVSERTEDTPLLTEDEARRMDLDEVIRPTLLRSRSGPPKTEPVAQFSRTNEGCNVFTIRDRALRGRRRGRIRFRPVEWMSMRSRTFPSLSPVQTTRRTRRAAPS